MNKIIMVGFSLLSLGIFLFTLEAESRPPYVVLPDPTTGKMPTLPEIKYYEYESVSSIMTFHQNSELVHELIKLSMSDQVIDELELKEIRALSEKLRLIDAKKDITMKIDKFYKGR